MAVLIVIIISDCALARANALRVMCVYLKLSIIYACVVFFGTLYFQHVSCSTASLS